MKKLGRKTLLTQKLQAKLCQLLENASTIKTACGAVGISERVFYEWAAEKPHFAQATNRARSLAKIRLIGIIMAAAPKDWRAAMELLSRLAPAEFGRVWRSEPVPSQETAIPVQFFLPREDGTTVEVPYDKLPATKFAIIDQRSAPQPSDEDGTDDHDDVSLRQLRRNGDALS
jgi:hypothetical protein